jgi:hypothetical protein
VSTRHTLLISTSTSSRRTASVLWLRALNVEVGRRTDGRWSLRLSLQEPRLEPVFAALCRDIVGFTRYGIDEPRLGSAVLARLNHWRTLLEREAGGLGATALQGLIGELLVLEIVLLGRLTLREAAASWTGPRGTPQDFMLPSGERIEVKTVREATHLVRVNGLRQLDGGGDPVFLVVVRVEMTGPSATDAITAPSLIARLRETFSSDLAAFDAFEAMLASAGWHDDPSHEAFAVRLIGIEEHRVEGTFPRLTNAMVPIGVEEADYTIALPGTGRVLTKGDR